MTAPQTRVHHHTNRTHGHHHDDNGASRLGASSWVVEAEKQRLTFAV